MFGMLLTTFAAALLPVALTLVLAGPRF